MLRKRGEYIKSEDWDKMDEVNGEICESIKDQEFLDLLQTPCTVFATWENEEGYQCAGRINEHIKDGELPTYYKEFLGGEFNVQPTKEPTDIIWENRHFTEFERNKRRMYSAIIIIIVLLFSGFVIYACTSIRILYKEKYPKVDCKRVQAMEMDDVKQWEIDAIRQHKKNYDLWKIGQKQVFKGNFQCFCKYQK